MAYSDKTISDSSKKSIITSRKKEFRDLDLSLTLHPTKKDIIPLRDDQAIKNSLKNLLVSNFFERPFQPTLGANLSGVLFEPPSVLTETVIRDSIRTVIANEEPRVRTIGIGIIYVESDDTYRVNVKFLIKENDQEEQLDIRLRRLR
tara:strand:- start:108 stop:548 length:441 start_codon:yes stop_codon:yes gene_type:complete